MGLRRYGSLTSVADPDHMSDPNDPFSHHPELRGRIVPYQQSRFRDIDLREIDDRLRELGHSSPRRVPDEQREAGRQQVLTGRWDDDLWVFAYGSLMWDPALHFAEVRRARLEGYQRRFCLEMTFGRGTHERPGLTLGLVPGAGCEGLAFRIPADRIEVESEIVWRREVLFEGYVPTFASIDTVRGEEEALIFATDTTSEHYVGQLGFEEQARRMAHASGDLGSGFEYLENVVEQLTAVGIEDPEIVALYARADELRKNAGAGR